MATLSQWGWGGGASHSLYKYLLMFFVLSGPTALQMPQQKRLSLLDVADIYTSNSNRQLGNGHHQWCWEAQYSRLRAWCQLFCYTINELRSQYINLHMFDVRVTDMLAEPCHNTKKYNLALCISHDRYCGDIGGRFIYRPPSGGYLRNVDS